MTKYCAFHQGPGYIIEDCYQFSDMVYDWHEQERIVWNEMAERKKALFAQDEVQRTSLGVHFNPMPSHSAPLSGGEVNMVQISDEVDEEILNWADEGSLIEWHSSTSEGSSSLHQVATHKVHLPKPLNKPLSSGPLIRPYSAVPPLSPLRPPLYNLLSLQLPKSCTLGLTLSMPGFSLLNKPLQRPPYISHPRSIEQTPVASSQVPSEALPEDFDIFEYSSKIPVKDVCYKLHQVFQEAPTGHL